MKPRNPAAQAKAVERNKLKELTTITVTIQATENNLQRLAAFMLFADHLEPVVSQKPTLLPWEDPETAPTAPLELDYEVVRRGIIKRLEPYVKEHGREKVLELLRAHGGETLSQVPENRLMDLFDALI